MHSARSPFSPDVFGLPSEPLDQVDLLLTLGITLGGVGHVFLTPFYYRHESGLNQAWFAGSGLALAAVGMLNLSRIRGEPTAALASKVLTPATALCLGVAAWQNREFQTVAGTGLAALLAALALRK